MHSRMNVWRLNCRSASRRVAESLNYWSAVFGYDRSVAANEMRSVFTYTKLPKLGIELDVDDSPNEGEAYMD